VFRLQDAAFHRLSAQKKAQWEKNNAFYTNRAFSREVRKVGAEAERGGGEPAACRMPPSPTPLLLRSPWQARREAVLAVFP
jgi:hypothetical protein